MLTLCYILVVLSCRTKSEQRVPYEPEPSSLKSDRREDDDDSAPVMSFESEQPLAELLSKVHGGRALHFGAQETWRRAKLAFPTAKISIEGVREFVRDCSMCQKYRNTDSRGLPSMTLSLKPDTYRKRVGVDHVTITPKDKLGNCCAILVVEHWAHFPQAYAAPDYSAEYTARALFKHFCTFGLFHEIISDPGSAFMSDTVRQLNAYLPIIHRVSLVGRHESNGCEAIGREYLRHLAALVQDEDIKDKWSADTSLPLINFMIASTPSSETGGFTPFQLKYGSEDASFFKLPAELKPGDNQFSEFIRQLDKNIQTIRRVSSKFQDEIKEKRSTKYPVPSYVTGDFVLWNPREHPNAHLDSKLSPPWKGPYEVISQDRNDVSCEHVVNRTRHVFHVDRIKPFFGSRQDAEQIARADDDQHIVSQVLGYSGNPHVRRSMTFHVQFTDGDVCQLYYHNDLTRTEQFQAYVTSEPYLFPLRHTAAEAKRLITTIRRSPIPLSTLQQACYLLLRFWDGDKYMWFDSLNLPEQYRSYWVKAVFTSFANSSHTTIKVHVPVFSSEYILDAYDIQVCTLLTLPRNGILVDHSLLATYPSLLPA